MIGELARGALALDRLFGRNWTRALVPPYNRIAASLASALPLAGYIGLSTYGPRRPADPALSIVNTHVDIIDWTPRAFLGESAALALIVKHLRARREGRVDADEPTGLLTHHLAHDEGCWNFIDRVLGRLRAHPAVTFSLPWQAGAALTTHRYPPGALLGDYARAGIGIVLTAGPALAVPTGSVGQYILLPLTALFVAFAARTFWRQISIVEMGPEGLSVANPRPTRLSWDKLRDVRLRYYWTKSDRTGGWMQLTLKGEGATIRLDSALDGFVDIARRAARAVAENGLTVSPVTATNFGSLGIDLAHRADAAMPSAAMGQRHG